MSSEWEENYSRAYAKMQSVINAGVEQGNLNASQVIDLAIEALENSKTISPLCAEENVALYLARKLGQMDFGELVMEQTTEVIAETLSFPEIQTESTSFRFSSAVHELLIQNKV